MVGLVRLPEFANGADRSACPHWSPQFYRTLASLALFFILVSPGLAQLPSVTDTTSTPTPNAGHDYIEGMAETVNPANGSLSIRIGVPLPKSRGVNIPFNFSYDSNGAYYLAPFPGEMTTSGFMWWDASGLLSQGGWSYSVPMMSVQNSPFVAFDDDNNPVSCDEWTDYVMQDASGNRTNLGLAIPNYAATWCGVYPTPPNQGPRTGTQNLTSSAHVGPYFATTDPTWYNNVNRVDVFDADGTDYAFGPFQAPSLCPQTSGVIKNCTGSGVATQITDRNGNTATLASTNAVSSAALSSLSYTDTIGRTALSIAGFGTSADTVTVSGQSQPYTVQWTTVTGRYSISMVNQPQQGGNNCGNSDGGHNQPTIQAVSSITLPNQQKYHFTYDPTYGTVSKITYPTGGYVRYVWGLNSQSEYGKFPIFRAIPTDGIDGEGITTYNGFVSDCVYYYDTPAITKRFVSYDGTNEVEEQDFSYSTVWDNSDPKEWAQKQATVLTKDLVRNEGFNTIYTYSGAAPDNQPDAVSYSLIPVESSIQYYGTDGTLLRTVKKQWHNVRTMTQQQQVLDNGETSQTTWNYDVNEMVTEKDDYDFGPNAPSSAALRKTIFPSYHSFATHIVDKPDSVKLEDGSGNVVAGVSYVYESNGNTNSRTDWLNQTGSSGLTTGHTYDGYGNIHTTTDPAGNQTTYNYADSFAENCSSGSGANTNAYLTSINHPSTGGIAHTESFKYHCDTGYLASSTDQNSQTTSYIYNDSLRRLTETDYPAGWGKAIVSYNDTPGALSVESKRMDGAAHVWSDSVDLYDGMFHQIAQSSQNGESTGGPWNRTDICYDGVGRTSATTYAYQTSLPTGTSSCGGSGDRFTYDALDRPTSNTHSISGVSATVATTSYKGRATVSMDEGNGTGTVERITQSDALGRLNAVCEVTNQAQNGVSPSPCGLDVSNVSGFLTSYQYTARGDLQTITQGAQMRSFVYDLASRLTQSTNPETGTINYNYDTDVSCPQAMFAGELISKVDVRGVRTCMQYDALHRLLGKAYSGASISTPSVTYSYDETSKYGIALTNTVGRMSSQSTAGSYPTGSVFSYDTLGHVIDNSQCTPQNCGSTPASAYSITYSGYNVLGEPTTATNGAGITFTYGYNNFGRLTGVTSSLNDAAHPGSLLSNVHYNAFGSPVNSTIGAAPLHDIRQYDPRGRLTGISVSGDNATTSTGTITVSGAETGNGGPVPAAGTLTIQGDSAAFTVCDDQNNCRTVYGYGSVGVSVNNGYPYVANYDEGSTHASIAAALAATINSDSTRLVNASIAPTSDGIIILTSVASGASTNYPIAAVSSMNDFHSVLAYTSGATLTGGADFSGTPDAGTISVTANGVTTSANYGANDTSATVAASLAGAINTSPYLSASASGSVISVASKTSGANTNYSISTSSDSGLGRAPSFTAVSTSTSGGAGGNIYGVGIGYAPNSNIQNSGDSVNGFWSYTYDDFNRLNTATSNLGSGAARGCIEGYDRYGNRLSQYSYGGGMCVTTPTFTIPNNNNQPAQLIYEQTSNNTSSGNVYWDGNTNYLYDAENRIMSATGAFGCKIYVYDASGRRVRIRGASDVDQLYDLSGHVIAEMSTGGAMNRGEVYAGDAHLATYESGTTYFNHADWLGTERIRTTVTGGISAGSTWISYPFGEGSTAQNPGPTHFTGKERDTESGLDYFGARYYASFMGRWMSPDWADKPEAVPYSSLDNPQSLNLYGYVLNNPLSQADPNGHETPWGTPESSLRSANIFAGAAKGAWNLVANTWNTGANLLNAQGAANGGTYIAMPTLQTAGYDNATQALSGAVTTLGIMAAGAPRGTTGAAIDDAALSSRAIAIQGAQDAFGQTKSTTAAASVTDANGNTSVMIGSSRNALTPSQRAALQPGETAVTGPGHAETTVINAAQSQGMRVNAVAASRPTCPSCSQAIQNARARQVTPTKPQ